jgi:hypothetical protein
MAVCDYCNKNFNFFGVSENGYTYCSGKCKDQAQALLKCLDRFNRQEIDAYIERVHSGPCKQCGQSRPVDFYQSYRVFSVIIFTRWTTHNHFVCRPCARNEQLKSLAYSALLGWWGFPFGLILTPIQIIRNIVGLAGSSDGSRPSVRLQNLLRLNLARQVAAGDAATRTTT